MRESALNDKVKYYQEQIKKNQLKAIQFDLQLVGGYSGQLDGVVGPEFRRSVGRVATLYDLAPNIDYRDPMFLRALGSATLAHKVRRY